MVNVVDQTGVVRQDAAVTDITRLLLEARRSLASELDADLGERGYPDLRPGHAALFLSVDRRSGSRLTDLAEQTRLTKQAMMSMVDDLENRGYVRRVPDPGETPPPPATVLGRVQIAPRDRPWRHPPCRWTT